MHPTTLHFKHSLTCRVICASLVFFFSFGTIIPPYVAEAQVIPMLPIPGAMVVQTPGFVPALIKGITIHPENPLAFDFIIDTGDSGIEVESQAFKDESMKLVKYFLASLTVPAQEMWVNLSPYEQDRVIPESFGKTEMGMDLLAQDYILKQLTASLIYPEKDLGKKFWDRVYERAQKEFGTTDIKMDNFHKVWIVPSEAFVYEKDNTAFVVKSHLKVMLEQDYMALKGVQSSELRAQGKSNELSQLQTEVMREIVLPEIEKEVNEGANFANLRQIYQGMILATWFKQNLKESLLGQVYVDQKKVKGVDTDDPAVKEEIYKQYVEAFEKGVYNYIKEDYDPATNQVIPRQYFSGGFDGPAIEKIVGSVNHDRANRRQRTEGTRAINQRRGSIGDAEIRLAESAPEAKKIAQRGSQSTGDSAMLTRADLGLENVGSKKAEEILKKAKDGVVNKKNLLAAWEILESGNSPHMRFKLGIPHVGPSLVGWTETKTVPVFFEDFDEFMGVVVGTYQRNRDEAREYVNSILERPRKTEKKSPKGKSDSTIITGVEFRNGRAIMKASDGQGVVISKKTGLKFIESVLDQMHEQRSSKALSLILQVGYEGNAPDKRPAMAFFNALSNAADLGLTIAYEKGTPDPQAILGGDTGIDYVRATVRSSTVEKKGDARSWLEALERSLKGGKADSAMLTWDQKLSKAESMIHNRNNQIVKVQDLMAFWDIVSSDPTILYRGQGIIKAFTEFINAEGYANGLDIGFYSSQVERMPDFRIVRDRDTKKLNRYVSVDSKSGEVRRRSKNPSPRMMGLVEDYKRLEKIYLVEFGSVGDFMLMMARMLEYNPKAAEEFFLSLSKDIPQGKEKQSDHAMLTKEVRLSKAGQFEAVEDSQYKNYIYEGAKAKAVYDFFAGLTTAEVFLSEDLKDFWIEEQKLGDVASDISLSLRKAENGDYLPSSWIGVATAGNQAAIHTGTQYGMSGRYHETRERYNGNFLDLNNQQAVVSLYEQRTFRGDVPTIYFCTVLIKKEDGKYFIYRLSDAQVDQFNNGEDVAWTANVYPAKGTPVSDDMIPTVLDSEDTATGVDSLDDSIGPDSAMLASAFSTVFELNREEDGKVIGDVGFTIGQRTHIFPWGDLAVANALGHHFENIMLSTVENPLGTGGQEIFEGKTARRNVLFMDPEGISKVYIMFGKVVQLDGGRKTLPFSLFRYSAEQMYGEAFGEGVLETPLADSAMLAEDAARDVAVQAGLNYWEMRQAGQPIGATRINQPIRASQEEDVPDVFKLDETEALELERIGARSLLDGKGAFLVLEAGASSRMNPADAPANVREMVGGKDIKSKAGVPIGRLDGEIVTYHDFFFRNVAGLLSALEREANEAGVEHRVWDNAYGGMTNADYREEHVGLFQRHRHYGLDPNNLHFFNQPLGYLLQGTPKDVELLRSKLGEKRYKIAKDIAKRVEEQIKTDPNAVILEGDRQPMGHAEFLFQLIVSNTLLWMIEHDKEWFAVRNTDNVGGKYDRLWLRALGLMLRDGVDFQPEVSPRSPGMNGGALVIDEENGNHLFVEDPTLRATTDANGDPVVRPQDSFWFNNATATGTVSFLLDLIQEEGQTKDDVIAELKAARNDLRKREAIAERAREKFVVIIDPKPAKVGQGVSIKRELNLWNAALAVSPQIKVRAVGVRGARNFPINQYSGMSAQEKTQALSELRFLSAKFWDLSDEEIAKIRTEMEADGHKVTDAEVLIGLEAYEHDRVLYQDLIDYVENPANLVTPGLLRDHAMLAVDYSVLNEQDTQVLRGAEKTIADILKAGFDKGAFTKEVYERSLANTFQNLAIWTTDPDIYRLSPGVREANLKAMREGRWDDLIEANRSEVPFGTAGIRGFATLTQEELLLLKEYGPSAAILKGPNTINDITLLKKTQAVINMMKANGQTKVEIGYDSRVAGQQFAELLARQFIGASTPEHMFQIFLFDEASPFPELSFGVREMEADWGIFISASHNPRRYNGYKITRSNGAQLNQKAKEEVLSSDKQVKLSDIKVAGSLADAKEGQLVWLGGDQELEGKDYHGFPLVDMHSKHIAQVKKFLLDNSLIQRQGKNVKIGFAAYNGSGYKAVPRLLTETGFANFKAVTKLQKMDGMFPAFNPEEQPDPGDPIAGDVAVREFIDEYGQEVFDELDAVIGTDPDADRMGLTLKVPENQQKYLGKYRLLPANDTWTLLIWYRLMKKQQMGLLDPEKSRVLFSHVTTDALEATAELFGVKSAGDMLDKTGTQARGGYLNDRRTWVGFTYIGDWFEKLLEQGYYPEAGAEESNGFSIGGHVLDKDGTFAAILMAEVLAYAKDQGTTAVELLDNIYRQIGFYATANKPLPRVGSFKGAAGVSEKIKMVQKAEEWMKQANERAGTDNPLMLSGREVIGAVSFGSNRVDALHYKDIPDEGIRFFFKDAVNAPAGTDFTKSRNYITLRISGTSQTIRAYTQLWAPFNVEGEEAGKLKAQMYADAEAVSLIAQAQLIKAVNLQEKHLAPVVTQLETLNKLMTDLGLDVTMTSLERAGDVNLVADSAMLTENTRTVLELIKSLTPDTAVPGDEEALWRFKLAGRTIRFYAMRSEENSSEVECIFQDGDREVLHTTVSYPDSDSFLDHDKLIDLILSDGSALGQDQDTAMLVSFSGGANKKTMPQGFSAPSIVLGQQERVTVRLEDNETIVVKGQHPAVSPDMDFVISRGNDGKLVITPGNETTGVKKAEALPVDMYSVYFKGEVSSEVPLLFIHVSDGRDGISIESSMGLDGTVIVEERFKEAQRKEKAASDFPASFELYTYDGKLIGRIGLENLEPEGVDADPFFVGYDLLRNLLRHHFNSVMGSTADNLLGTEGFEAVEESTMLRRHFLGEHFDKSRMLLLNFEEKVISENGKKILPFSIKTDKGVVLVNGVLETHPDSAMLTTQAQPIMAINDMAANAHILVSQAKAAVDAMEKIAGEIETPQRLRFWRDFAAKNDFAKALEKWSQVTKVYPDHVRPAMMTPDMLVVTDVAEWAGLLQEQLFPAAVSEAVDSVRFEGETASSAGDRAMLTELYDETWINNVPSWEEITAQASLIRKKIGAGRLYESGESFYDNLTFAESLIQEVSKKSALNTFSPELQEKLNRFIRASIVAVFVENMSSAWWTLKIMKTGNSVNMQDGDPLIKAARDVSDKAGDDVLSLPEFQAIPIASERDLKEGDVIIYGDLSNDEADFAIWDDNLGLNSKSLILKSNPRIVARDSAMLTSSDEIDREYADRLTDDRHKEQWVNYARELARKKKDGRVADGVFISQSTLQKIVINTKLRFGGVSDFDGIQLQKKSLFVLAILAENGLINPDLQVVDDQIRSRLNYLTRHQIQYETSTRSGDYRDYDLSSEAKWLLSLFTATGRVRAEYSAADRAMLAQPLKEGDSIKDFFTPRVGLPYALGWSKKDGLVLTNGLRTDTISRLNWVENPIIAGVNAEGFLPEVILITDEEIFIYQINSVDPLGTKQITISKDEIGQLRYDISPVAKAFIVKYGEVDHAMLTEKGDVGGIDLNPEFLDLKIKRDGAGIPLPLPQQSIEQMMQIEGFLPVIINVTPIQNLPMLLGMDVEPEGEDNNGSNRLSQLDAMDKVVKLD